MGLNAADQYYLKALDYYPYNLEEAVEALNYALGHDEDHCQANCLMGRVFMEQMKEYEMADYYFEKALMSDFTYPDTFKYYSLLKIWKGEMCKAQKIIDYSLRVRGMDRAVMLHRKAMVYEYTGRFFEAKLCLQQIKLMTTNEKWVSYANKELSRLKKKVKTYAKLNKVQLKKGEGEEVPSLQ